MKPSRSLGLVVLLSVANFCSCGSASFTPAPTMTGNWVLSAQIPNPRVLDGNGQPTYIPVTSWAYLSQDGTSVSGMVADYFCESNISTFPVVGSLNGSQLTLMPAGALPPGTEYFSLNAMVSANLTTLQGDASNTPLTCG